MTKRHLSPWASALILVLLCIGIGGVSNAQEPERKPDSVAPKTDAQPAQKPAKPEAEKQEPAKPEPARKGAIQNADAPKGEEAGAKANLGTDVAAVRQRIEAALQSDPSLKGTAFTINVTDDSVEISGVANSGRERIAARRIAQSFAGNLRVKDRITVAGVTPPSAGAGVALSDQTRAKTEGEADSLAKPESDEQAPAKKANKPKKEPAKHGDQATEDPRDPRKKN